MSTDRYILRYKDEQRSLDLAEFELEGTESGIIPTVGQAEKIASAIGEAMELFRDFKFVGSFKLRGAIQELSWFMWKLGTLSREADWYDFINEWSEYGLSFVETGE